MQIRPSLRSGRLAKPLDKTPLESPSDKELADAALTDRLEALDVSDLRKLAGVKSPGFFRRVAKMAGNIFQGIRLALAVAPTVGHTILAKELAQIESKYKGGPVLAPTDWLRQNQPDRYAASISTMLEAASAPMQKSFGLSPSDLATVQEHYYGSMAPVIDDTGFKTTAPFLQEIAKRSTQEPGQASAAFVFLGEGLKHEAEQIMGLWNSEDRPPTNPFPDNDQRSIIWKRLEKENGQGKLPIFVDMDGDYSTFTGTEFVGKTTLASLRERNNRLGDDFADSGVYFAWLTARQESHSREFFPYLSGQDPALAATLVEVKEKLTPPWLNGPAGMGLWPAQKQVREIPSILDGVKAKKGEAGWIDSVVSLDRDVLTGVQTHWTKLLRELPRAERQEFLNPLVGITLDWNLRAPGEANFAQVAPSDAPELRELNCEHDPVEESRPYDRSSALQEVLDHTLDGLGIAERRSALSQIRSSVSANMGRLEAREARLQATLGQDYSGLDISKVVAGSLGREEFEQGLAQLNKAARQAPRQSSGQEARRHAELLEFLYKMEGRYGEVDQVIHRLQGDFEKNPFGVSEFFIPPAPGATVTPMREANQVPIRLGNPNDPNPMKLSQVLEGGGGRGFAYPGTLSQIEAALADSKHGYEIDEFIGTSAGSMPAVLLAAGFSVEGLRQQMEAIDFKAFNADAVWMMGGVDPKVRGIDRSGLFSTQMMYKTFSKVLSEKLGIEGRPVLFRDMPHKLKIVTTMMNTDLPEDSPLRELLDEDGRFVFSTENTPNFDVAGALAASSAVPFFFQSPQMLVAKPGPNGELERARLQLADGGTVDNLSTSSASTEEKKRALIQLPVHTSTIDPRTGLRTSLDTLNFDSGNLDVIDAHNKKLYDRFAPKLDDYLQAMKSHGVGRTVLGYNLAEPSQQALPAIQGNTEELSLRGLIRAKSLGMPTLDKAAGDAIIKFSERPPSIFTNVGGELFNRYMDDRPGEGDGTGDFHRTSEGFHYHPPTDEETDIFSMARAAGGAALSAGITEHQERRFEK